MFRSTASHRRVSRFALAALTVLTAAPLAALSGSTPAAHATTTDSAVTVTQSNKSLYAYDPSTGGLNPNAPTVTVDQTANLYNQVVHLSWKNFTPSHRLDNNPGFVFGGTQYAVGIYECRGTNPAVSPYIDGENNTETDCYRWTTAQQGNADHGLANAVDTFTSADGTGDAYIQIETLAENDLLGCDVTHPCSLVVVPQNGGPITDTYNKRKCATHKSDLESALDHFIGDGCSWQARLTVPLTFAPTTSTACSTTPSGFSAGGSPMLARAMAQWRPGWCGGSLPVNFDYNPILSEDEARTSFASTTFGLSKPLDVALTTQPLTPDLAQNRAFTYAPIANTDVAVAFVIDDDAAGTQLTDLKLNARLMAKLLTQSYSLNYGRCTGALVQGPTCDPAVNGNPNNILDDPEFRELNPNWADLAQGQSPTLDLGTFLPTVVLGDSDVTYALTRWIASDPSAASFLAGTPDKWGMHINTYYKNPGWPTQALFEQDPGYNHSYTADGLPVPGESQGYCVGNGTMQVAWGPITGLDNVANTLLGNRSTSQDPTEISTTPCTYSKVAPESTGTRFLLAVMDQGQASSFQFPTAQLENSAGAFVAPTTASVTAGVANQTTNPDGITQQENLAAKNAAAYPLTVTDYALVPTCQLPSATADSVSDMLRIVEGTGQTSGDAPGTLAAGYLPLTAKQLAQTRTAQAAVLAQKICLPPTPTDTGTGGSTSTGTVSGSGGTSPAAASAPVSTGSPALPTGTSQTQLPAARTPLTASTPLAYGHKYGTSGRLAVLLPVLLAGALLLLVGVPTAYLLAAGEGAPAWLRRLRPGGGAR